MKFSNKHALAAVVALGLAAVAGTAAAQVAGTTTVTTSIQKTPLGVSVTEAQIVAVGWSAKKSILGKDIYNDVGEKIGKVTDLIIAPDSSVSYAIIGVGPFVGLTRNDVSIPVGQFKPVGGRLVLPGATKDALKALPKFEYTKR